MKVIEGVKELQKELDSLRKLGKSIGFVPTLGALHTGHASLINVSIKKADVTVASIFVNPTQFNEKSDLKKYPRTFESDKKLLVEYHCDILFYPTVIEIYPDGTNKRPDFSLDGLDLVLEGAFRPGHFDGVVQVVKRLLDIVQPDYLMMGQKDFQQFTIVQHMIDHFAIKTELVVCPIIREDSGLAMSSRNVRLSPKERKASAAISKTLLYAKRRLKKNSVQEVKEYAVSRLNSFDGFKTEYFEIVNGKTLLAIEAYSETNYIVACVAVWVGEVRLIDNKIYKK